MSSSSRVKVALTRHLQQHALGLRSGTCARLLMANETRRCTDAPSRGSIIQVYRMGGMMEDDLARICCRAEEARPTDRPTRSVGCVAMAHRALTGREKARSLRSCGRGACLLVALCLPVRGSFVLPRLQDSQKAADDKPNASSMLRGIVSASARRTFSTAARQPARVVVELISDTM